MLAHIIRVALLTAIVLVICRERAPAAFLPPQIAPPAPFPLVLTQSLEREFVAPGVERATYRLQTSAGPIVVSIVRVDTREPSVHLGTVLAHDRLVSAGESVSSMAARTGAVAGINADYFDIGNTNTPLGVVAQNGSLVRTPSSRVAFTFARDRSVRFAAYHFSGTAVDNGSLTIPLTSVNEWPPHEGAAFITPAFGVPTPAPQCLIAELTPVAAPNGATPAPPAGRYRVTQIDTDTVPAQPTYALALGPAARGPLTTLPDVGDLIDISLTTDPPFTDALAAAGGGPGLLANGSPVDDPASPGYVERARRIPIAAAGRFADGDIAFVVVDGRHPVTSIGVDRDELIALFSGLGAVDAMQFDSGGSATLVARVLGESRATVQNEPSDGLERPVADGLFVYSDAPVGPPARLVVRPSAIEALPDTAIALRSTIVDAAGHPLGDARGEWRVSGAGARIDANDILHTANAPLATTLELGRAGVRAIVPLEIVMRPAKIAIAPERPNPQPGASIALHARAYDERNRPIETANHITWSALRGTVTADGTYTAGATDGFVTAAIGDLKSSEIVRVGRHRALMPGFDPTTQAQWHFSSVPVDGPGALDFTPQGTLQLHYDFRDTERAAYANAGVTLGEPLAISCAIDGDAQGVGIRIALLDRYGERSAITLAKTIDWSGSERRDVRVPVALAPPIVLQSFYAIGSLGAMPVKTAGTIGVHGCDLTLPGAAPTSAPSSSTNASGVEFPTRAPPRDRGSSSRPRPIRE